MSIEEGRGGAHCAEPRRTGPLAIVTAVVILIAATLVAWFRLSAVARGTLWAEDGRNFISDQLTNGVGDSIFRPFGGYLQLLPRLLAAIATSVSGPEHLAQTVTLLACATVGAVSALLFLYSRTLFRTPIAACLLAAIPPLIPTAPRESLGTLNNLHSFVLLLVPFLFASIPRSWWTSAGSTVIAVVVLLSEPQAALFAPLLLRGIRSRRKWPMIAAAVVCTVADAVTAVLFPREHIDYGSTSNPTAWDVVLGFITVPVASMWTTQLAAVGSAVHEYGAAALIALTVCLVAVAAAGVIFGRATHRWLIPATLLGAGATWAAAIVVTPSGGMHFSDNLAPHIAAFGPIRYATLVSGFLLIAIVTAADAISGHGVARNGVAVLSAAAITASLVVNVPGGATSTRDLGPTIASQLAAARATCEQSDKDAVSLRQAPDRAPWSTTLPCAYIRR